MIKTEKKLSIFLKLGNIEFLDFLISPTGSIEKISQDEYVYSIELDINVKNKVIVQLLNKPKINSYLQITKIQLGTALLNHFDSFSTYSANGKIKKTYGWMDEVGSYTINIHGNAVSQNLLLFLLSTKNHG